MDQSIGLKQRGASIRGCNVPYLKNVAQRHWKHNSAKIKTQGNRRSCLNRHRGYRRHATMIHQAAQRQWRKKSKDSDSIGNFFSRRRKNCVPFLLAPTGLACIVGTHLSLLWVGRSIALRMIRTILWSGSRGVRRSCRTFPMSTTSTGGRWIPILRRGAACLRNRRGGWGPYHSWKGNLPNAHHGRGTTGDLYSSSCSGVPSLGERFPPVRHEEETTVHLYPFSRGCAQTEDEGGRRLHCPPSWSLSTSADSGDPTHCKPTLPQGSEIYHILRQRSTTD